MSDQDQPIRNISEACKQGVYCMRFFTTIPLLLTETQFTQLKIILKHQALSWFELALHLISESFNFSALRLKSVISRLAKKPFC